MLYCCEVYVENLLAILISLDSVVKLNFGMNVISPETRMMGIPYGEEIMIVGRTMWTQSTSVTDGRTDRQTDGRTDGQNYDN